MVAALDEAGEERRLDASAGALPSQPVQNGRRRREALAPGAPVEDRLRQLTALRLFRGLSPSELFPLATASEVVTFPPLAEIVRQGDPGESVYVICDGRVEVRVHSEQDGTSAEAVVAWLMPGDAVGELSLLDGDARSATCVALAQTTCLRLDRAAFLATLREHWAVTEALLVVLAHRLRMADKLVAEHARDPLTGLNNRRALAELYEREAARAERAARQGEGDTVRPMAVLFADVDSFKEINDRFGHQIGDKVLRSVAETLNTVSRATDVVIRYGGDEFVLLLPDAGEDGAEAVAERIRQELRARVQEPVPVTLSIGAAVTDPVQPRPLEALLAEADAAMYREKALRHGSGPEQAN